MANKFYSLPMNMTNLKLGVLVFMLVGIRINQVVRAKQVQTSKLSVDDLPDVSRSPKTSVAQIHKLESQWKVKCSADKFYGMFTHNATQLPEYIEGDGISVGTVRLWTYALVDSRLAVKERTTATDNEDRTITFNFFEGEVMNYYKTFVIKLAVIPKGGRSLVKWSLEFEKANEDVPFPTDYMNLMERISKELGPQLK